MFRAMFWMSTLVLVVVVQGSLLGQAPARNQRDTGPSTENLESAQNTQRIESQATRDAASAVPDAVGFRGLLLLDQLPTFLAVAGRADVEAGPLQLELGGPKDVNVVVAKQYALGHGITFSFLSSRFSRVRAIGGCGPMS